MHKFNIFKLKNTVNAFTLIELITAVTITAIVVVSIGVFINDITKKTNVAMAQNELNLRARDILNTIVRDIRSSDSSSIKVYADLAAATAGTSISFDSTLDQLGQVLKVNGKYWYFVNNGLLFKCYSATGNVLSPWPTVGNESSVVAFIPDVNIGTNPDGTPRGLKITLLKDDPSDNFQSYKIDINLSNLSIGKQKIYSDVQTTCVKYVIPN